MTAGHVHVLAVNALISAMNATDAEWGPLHQKLLTAKLIPELVGGLENLGAVA